ncbi:MAG: glycoside hydrolase, partial [Actinobacteria bacterium]|nr:glycoside hydrolase [Actinomycetota bacterium]
MEVSLTNYSPSTASDFDLYIYRSDASGTRGEQVASSGGVPGAEEHAVIKKASGYYLVQVVYYAVAASQYDGSATFVAIPRLNAPPDIDSPPGLQDFLASDPHLGYKSHSEPHMAQSPINSDLLIGGSKFYNKDRDSLAEYEFKIGTYVSFNGGKKWTDLGQMATCPLSQAPPESWPDKNTCYPVDIPTKGGTGPEDAKDNRGRGDVGEEYITSDVWIQFDDEGNAYAMVLDHPPYEDTGNGWGMTLHIWKSVSKADLKTGKTWGPRIPINFYGPDERASFLDDKNTFTVNNAGPDRDGTVGTMVACWGQNIPDAIKQQTVCERSTDGGQTWPDRPRPISGAEQLVIGVHVIADPSEPDTFYAAWLQYASGIADPNVSTLEFAVSLDGGINWAETPVTTVRTVPKFPYQDFRNNTIPIMAVAPNHDLYISYGDYRAAPKPDEDEDGLSSDIMVAKSTTRGASWETPVQVNQDGTNADQFQPYIDINKAGQINIVFFDRRN